MSSVEQWALASGYDYRLLGDELFEAAPDWYMSKVRGRMPIAADLGRLQWAQRFLRGGYDWVIWMDADMLVFAPERLIVDLQQACTFGQEHWVQAKVGAPDRWEVRKNIHNAFAAFPAECPVLPFFIDIILRMMRRVDPDHIAPQMMGPKLLSSLHNLAAFDFRPDIVGLSPEVMSVIAGDMSSHPDESALQALCKAQLKPLVAANLCASLMPHLLITFGDADDSDEVMQRVIGSLLRCIEGLSQPENLGA